MKNSASRRKFLKAGLAIPAAGLVSIRLGTPSQPSAAAPAGVAYRILGKTGLKVSTVGFGTASNPGIDILLRAFDLGVNYIDTAHSYGSSEETVGKAVKGRRDKVVIATKCGGGKKEEIFKDAEASLKALGTDYVDVLLLHAADSPDRLTDDSVGALEEIKKQGKARFVGLSTHNPVALLDAILKSAKLDVVLTTYSYATGGIYRNEAIKTLNHAGVGVVAMKVTRAMTGIQMMEDMRRGVRMQDMNFAQKISSEACVSAIKWALANPAIATTVPGHASMEHLEMNVKAMTEPYTEKDERLLYAKSEAIRPYYCRMCYECSGQCPNGMPVTDVLRFLAYNDFGGNFHQARSMFHELPDKIRGIRCMDCASCAVQCPNGVRVRQRLIRAQQLLA